MASVPISQLNAYSMQQIQQSLNKFNQDYAAFSSGSGRNSGFSGVFGRDPYGPRAQFKSGGTYGIEDEYRYMQSQGFVGVGNAPAAAAPAPAPAPAPRPAPQPAPAPKPVPIQLSKTVAKAIGRAEAYKEIKDGDDIIGNDPTVIADFNKQTKENTKEALKPYFQRDVDPIYAQSYADRYKLDLGDDFKLTKLV